MRGAAVAGAADVDHVEVVRLDHAVQVDVDEVQPRRRAPVAQQARLDVLDLERLLAGAGCPGGRSDRPTGSWPRASTDRSAPAPRPRGACPAASVTAAISPPLPGLTWAAAHYRPRGHESHNAFRLPRGAGYGCRAVSVGSRPCRERCRGWRCSPISTTPEIEELLPDGRGGPYDEGQWVVRRGEVDVGLHIIVDGEVSVVLEGDELAALSKGSFFGEISALLGEPTVADIIARTPLQCLFVPPEDVESLPRREPPRDVPDAPGGGSAAADHRRAPDLSDARLTGSWAGLRRRPLVDYLPIAEHGIIGDLHTHRARRHRRDDRLVLLPALRLAERLRRDPRQGARAASTASRPTTRGLDAEAALLPGHERPDHALPHPGRRRRGAGLHADPAAARPSTATG